MLEHLSIVYPKMANLNPTWYGEFLACFTDSAVERIEVAGQPDNLQAGRGLAFSLATRKYVTSPDPDDLFDLEAYRHAVQYLEEHPEIAAVSLLEQRITFDGQALDQTPVTGLTPMAVFSNPMAMHVATVFRTTIIQGAITTLSELTFCNYDWALRIYIAGNYPIHRLPVMAYRYRWHRQGHRTKRTVPTDAIPARDTYKVLAEKGFLTHTKTHYVDT